MNSDDSHLRLLISQICRCTFRRRSWSGADLGGGLGWPWPPQMEAWPPLWPPHFVSSNTSDDQDDMLCVPPRNFGWPPQMPPQNSKAGSATAAGRPLTDLGLMEERGVPL